MRFMKARGPLLDDRRLFHEVISRLCLNGTAEADVEWAETRGDPADAEEFATETVFVICNSGMQNRIARQIFDRCMTALRAGTPVSDVFGHKGKSDAIESVWADRENVLQAYLSAVDKVDYCRSLPWVGDITSFHLAKSFGAQVAKPDVHLQRLADRHGTTAQELCEILSSRTGFSVGSVDLILWRACADRILDARTGTFRDADPAPAPVRTSHQHELFQPVQQEMFP